MPVYVIQATVKVWGRNATQAYSYVQQACDRSRHSEIIVVDQEYTAIEEDLDDEPEAEAV